MLVPSTPGSRLTGVSITGKSGLRFPGVSITGESGLSGVLMIGESVVWTQGSSFANFKENIQFLKGPSF
jgi:hypothetical protein